MNNYRKKYEKRAEENPFLFSHDIVEEVLRNDICTCIIAPGEHLPEVRLAEQFGVSRTTIRRAFESLLNEGWLVHDGKQGVKVAPMIQKQYMEIVELRSHLDPFAAQLAAVRRTTQDLARLEANVYVPLNLDYFCFYQADMAFHKAIYRAAHNEYLFYAYEHISVSLARVKAFVTGGTLMPEDKQRTNDEHLEIFEAILHQNRKAAYRLALSHSKMVLTNMANLIFDSEEMS